MLKVTCYTETSHCVLQHCDGVVWRRACKYTRSSEYWFQQFQRGGEEKVILAGTADSWVQSGSEVRHWQQWGTVEESKNNRKTRTHTHTHTHTFGRGDECRPLRLCDNWPTFISERFPLRVRALMRVFVLHDLPDCPDVQSRWSRVLTFVSRIILISHTESPWCMWIIE